MNERDVRNDRTMRTPRSARFRPFPTFPTFPTFLTLLAACHSSPQKEQEKSRQELASWDATAQLTRELAERGALPRVYVRQVSKTVEEGKQKVRQRADKSSQ